jgi:hypothetical protein
MRCGHLLVAHVVEQLDARAAALRVVVDADRRLLRKEGGTVISA